MTGGRDAPAPRVADWKVVLWMLAGGIAAATLPFAFIAGTLGSVIGGLVFWPGAFIAGCWAVRGEVLRGN